MNTWVSALQSNKPYQCFTSTTLNTLLLPPFLGRIHHLNFRFIISWIYNFYHICRLSPKNKLFYRHLNCTQFYTVQVPQWCFFPSNFMLMRCDKLIWVVVMKGLILVPKWFCACFQHYKYTRRISTESSLSSLQTWNSNPIFHEYRGVQFTAKVQHWS